MNLEEYTCETVPQSEEFTDEAKALVEKLGATGQTAFYQKEQTVCPYRKMTPQEHAVYKILLPQRQEISKFNAGPIPLRALQIGAHALELLTGTLVIWHAGIGKDDPLLTLREGSEWSGEYYLLARWAEELEEFPVLFEKAVKHHALKVQDALMQGKLEIDSWIASCESSVRLMLMNGKSEMPSIHWFR